MITGSALAVSAGFDPVMDAAVLAAVAVTTILLLEWMDHLARTPREAQRRPGENNDDTAATPACHA
jgi:hypothetical protein